MGRFNLVPKPTPEPVTNVREISGSFQCQTCNECVRTAKYVSDTGELVWRCSQKHISHIKEFMI